MSTTRVLFASSTSAPGRTCSPPVTWTTSSDRRSRCSAQDLDAALSGGGDVDATMGRLRALLAGHRSATGEPVGAACIHGDVYGTVSASTVIAGAHGVRYEHAPGRPCVTPFAKVDDARLVAGDQLHCFHEQQHHRRSPGSSARAQSATSRPRDGTGRVSRARDGIRHVSRSSSLHGSGGGSPPRADAHHVAIVTPTATTVRQHQEQHSARHRSGKIVDTTRITESISSTPRIRLASTLSHGRFTHGPSTSRSLHRNSRKRQALGQHDAGERLHRRGDQPERRIGNEHEPAASTTSAGEHRVEGLRLSPGSVQRVADAERVAECV